MQHTINQLRQQEECEDGAKTSDPLHRNPEGVSGRSLLRQTGNFFVNNMKALGTLRLRNRKFIVTDACLAKAGTLWTIEIETLCEEFDGERWQPYLYHQGLKLDAVQAPDLQRTRTAWDDPADSTYPYPQLGVMYVFGHHAVYNCELIFGSFEGGEIPIFWSGLCDVLWDTEFGSAVPFILECKAKI